MQAGWREGRRAGQAHAAWNYNVPAASTEAIQSPAGGQESLWREDTKGGERGGDTWEGGEDTRQKGQTHRRAKRGKDGAEGEDPKGLSHGVGWKGKLGTVR